jgi:hypothetical protein
MTDCLRQQVPLDEEGVFLFTVPRNDLHAWIWPYRLDAYDQKGNLAETRLISTSSPSNAAKPQPDSACASLTSPRAADFGCGRP